MIFIILDYQAASGPGIETMCDAAPGGERKAPR